jgi:hypothetical protein
VPLKFKLPSLDGLDDNLKALYRKTDQGYILDADGEAAEDIQGLKSALQKEKAEALELKQKLEGLSKNELAELKKLKKVAEDAERERLERDGNWEAVKSQILKKHQEEMEAVTSRMSGVQSQLERVLVDQAAMEAIVAHKGNPKLLLPIVKSALRLVEENGQQVVKVVNSQGQPIVANAKGDSMTIAGYVESLRSEPDYQAAFAASGASGGGSQGGSSGSINANKPLKDWTAEDKRSFIEKNGMDAWRDLVMGGR